MDGHFRVLDKSKNNLLKLPNVVGVGVGLKRVANETTGHLSLLVFVDKKYPAGMMRKEHIVPLKIGSFETDVVETGRIRFLNERTGRMRPASPGISIGHYKISAGTFGAVVRDKNTREKLILSNNHILANATNGFDERAAVGDPILQPGPHDGGGSRDHIASLLRFVPVKRAVQEVECPLARAAARFGNTVLQTIRPSYSLKFFKNTQDSNVIDSAVAKPDSPNVVDEEILEIGSVKEVGEVGPADQVSKSGRTSAFTKGKILAVGVTVKVDIADEEVGWFSDQIMTDLVSRPGDSGSLIVNSKKEAVGLLFAGSDKYTVFNRIQNVLTKLNLTF